MTKTKLIIRESLWLLASATGSFLFWCFSACVVDQCIILKDCLYTKESYAALATIGFIYFLRLNAWAIRKSIKKHAGAQIDTVFFCDQTVEEPMGTQKHYHGKQAPDVNKHPATADTF